MLKIPIHAAKGDEWGVCSGADRPVDKLPDAPDEEQPSPRACLMSVVSVRDPDILTFPFFTEQGGRCPPPVPCMVKF